MTRIHPSTQIIRLYTKKPTNKSTVVLVTVENKTKPFF